MEYPAIFEQYTEDDFERQELTASYVEPTSAGDDHDEEIQSLTQQLGTAARSLPLKHRQIVEQFFQGKSKTEIIDQLNTSYPTINKALGSSKGIQLFALYTQLTQLRLGPSLEARRAMIWRIAKRAEVKAPSVSLKALDLLNRQAGDYTPDETQEAGLTIKINNFTVNAAPNTPTTTPTDNILEGEFTPVKVNVPDA
jgi:hypothetical protein